jgi:23S rRNA pseudouridine1911/1915/1917 synthase
VVEGADVVEDDDVADVADVEADAATHTLTAGEGRLDAFVASAVEGLSRAQVQRLIADGQVAVGGAVATKAGLKLRPGDVIVVTVPAATPLEVVAEDLPLAILFEDADLIVIDKPAGLVVHPAPGHPRGTLVNALLFHCRDLAGIGGVMRPGIVHRLDRDTTGVMVVTKNDRAHAALTAAFAAKSRGEAHAGVAREYLAIAAPAPPAGRGTLRTLYGRHPVNRKEFSSKVRAGKAAVTHWEVVEALPLGAVVRLRLETGRTHQIRVHAADHGWPLLGDQVYGHRLRPPLDEIGATLGRQALHAAKLTLVHPRTGETLVFEAPLPADLEAALAALRALPR